MRRARTAPARALALAIAAATVIATGAACSPWPDLDPTDVGNAPDPHLGDEVVRSTRALRIATVFQADALIVVYEEVGAGWHAVAVAPDTGAVTSLPSPPLRPGESIALGRAMAPARAVVAVLRELEIATFVLDGDRWTAWPTLAVDGSAAAVGQVLAHDGRVYVSYGDRVQVSDGGGWRDPIAAAGRVVLGGFDAATQWMLTDAGGTFAAVPVDASGAAGAAIAGPPGAGGAEESAINGDADGFVVAAGDALWRYQAGEFAAIAGLPALAGATPYSAPGHDRLVLTTTSAPQASWSLFDGDTLVSALEPFEPVLPCDCDPGTDPACPCVTHSIPYVNLRPAPDGLRLAMTTADEDQGDVGLFVRFLDLPFAGSPLLD
ncbi:MAG: hypothetical protein H6709_18065 [Kofleriaceae bacterium]|nr:hypothetical protein [Myxococcales bacterium]MCB9559731.1 hypothetical protein [Kofleriaceae bacterium]MCB9573991.1 hypothetical protein [Kofleriaceae bacterium]